MRRNVGFLCVVAAWAAFVAMVLYFSTNASAEQYEPQEQVIEVQNEHIPGDDIPATTVCYLDPEDVQEDFENEKILAALLYNGHVIEDCKITHYDTCVKCCGKTDGITASGRKATPYVTVGVDPAVIPLDSDVLIDWGDGNYQYCRADDTGCIHGNHIDLCVTSHQEALQLGVKHAKVYWLEDGEL